MAKDLDQMTTDELGKLFPIIIADYNPDWPKIFLIEKQHISNILGNEVISSIEHIGSTSVPGLSAKPTIDILLEIKKNTDLNLLINKLQSISYQYIPKLENPPPHMMFAKGYSTQGIKEQTFHIHARYSGDLDEIIFRDFLRENPKVAQDYADLKRKLSIEFKHDRDKYTESKTAFIRQVTLNARLK